MSSIILSRTIKEFVRVGTGLPFDHVISGLSNISAPDGVLYASVTLMRESPMGMPTHRQVIGDDDSYTIDSQMMMASFDIQFFRDGAIEAANRFGLWARSESGVTWAATALTCGRLAGVNVYASGTGYTNGDSCVFHHDADDISPNTVATGTLEVDDNTGIRAITLNTAGSGYCLMPSVTISGAGQGASVSPRGYGFSVGRIVVRNITDPISGEFEERGQVDVDILYSRIYNDSSSGRVERIIGEQDKAILDSDNII